MSWVKHSLVAALVCALSGAPVWALSKPVAGSKQAQVADSVQRPVADRNVVAMPAAATALDQSVGDWVHHVRFADLGLAAGLMLSREQPQADVYIPVPSQVPLSKVVWSLPLQHLTSRTARAWLSVAVNDQPVAHLALGSINSEQVLQGVAKGGLVSGGFLRLTLKLEIEHARDELGQVCTSPVSVLIDPSAHVGYQTPVGAHLSVGDAWVLLPAVTHVTVPQGAMSAETYQAAWAVGTTLLRGRKQGAFRAFAALGETVNTASMVVPTAWVSVPAFQSLSSRSSVALTDPAQWAAWVLLHLSGPSAAGGVVLVDAPFVKSVADGLDKLRVQADGSGLPADARKALETWQAAWLKRLQQAVEQPVVQSVPTVSGGVLLLSANAYGAFSQLTDPTRAALLRASGDKWLARPQPVKAASEVRLSSLGLPTGSFIMMYRREWTGVLDLSNQGLSGEVPKTWVFDIATPSTAASERPMVSLYLNDQLLTSHGLAMDGKTQRVTAQVPASAVQVRNVLRAVFLRHDDQGQCFEAPLSFSIADTSHVVTHARELGTNFAGAGLSLAKGGHLVVSPQELLAPLASLPTLVWAGEAMAVDVNRLKVSSAPAGSAKWPTPFIATPGAEGVPTSPKNDFLQDALVGLPNGLIARAVSRDGGLGVQLQNQGAGLEALAPVSVFNHGSVALFNARGLGQLWDEEGRTRDVYQDDLREPWLRRNMGWWIPLLLVFSFVALLVAASVVRRKRAS